MKEDCLTQIRNMQRFEVIKEIEKAGKGAGYGA